MQPCLFCCAQQFSRFDDSAAFIRTLIYLPPAHPAKKASASGKESQRREAAASVRQQTLLRNSCTHFVRSAKKNTPSRAALQAHAIRACHVFSPSSLHSSALPVCEKIFLVPRHIFAPLRAPFFCSLRVRGDCVSFLFGSLRSPD